MNAPQNIVVIGGGLAGAKTVEALREQGHAGPITLVAGEPHLPYERPPLSKDYLAGKAGFDDAVVHPRQWYDEHDVDLQLDTRALSIDREARTVALSNGTTLPWDALVLATGSTPRRSDLPGADADGVLYLRRKEDSDAIRPFTAQGKRLVLIGGGWVGLEVAAVARDAGADVTVLVRDPLPLVNILGDEIAQVFADLHREHGVELLTQTEASEILVVDGKAAGVRLDDGREIAADAVVIGIGAIPDTALARDAGLELAAGGVAVDAALRTPDEAILAVGDIAAHDHPLLSRRIRVEHWATALNQPAAAAATILGNVTEYRELPYFYTDQFDLGMEYLGSAPAGEVHDVVVRGDLGKREFIAFWRNRAEEVLAVMAVNTWDVIDVVKPLLTNRRPVDADRLADPDVDLTDL